MVSTIISLFSTNLLAVSFTTAKAFGSILLSVWAHETSDTKRSNKDGLIKWEKRDKSKFYRYYHLFTYYEVYKLLIQVKKIDSFNIWYSNENFFVKINKE